MNALCLLLGTVLAVQPPTTDTVLAADPASVAASTQPQSQPQPLPQAPRIKRSTAYGLLLGGGIATAGLIWIGGMLGASRLDRGTARDREIGRALAIPVVGPFAAASMGTRKDRAPFIVLGVEQIVATAIMTAGAVGVHQHRVHDRAMGTRRDLKEKTTTQLMLSGVIAAGIFYGVTAGFSAGARESGRPRYGRRFLIPLVGGIAAAPNAPSNLAAVGALTSSALQLASVGVAAAGVAFAVRRRNHKMRLSVAPSIGRGRAQLSATLRF